jgi:transcriptional regulator with GAF, ATPase, and Fis domain
VIDYDWPGNVRELQNFVERALVLAEGSGLEIEAGLLPTANRSTAVREAAPMETSSTLDEALRSHLQAVLTRTGWVIDGPEGAARLLGLHPSTLRSRLQKLGLRRPS